MFVTALLLYLVATTSLNITGWLLVATVLVDIVAWATIENVGEAWFTGTTSDQKFWEDDE